MSKAMKAKTDVCFLSFSEGSKGHTSFWVSAVVVVSDAVAPSGQRRRVRVALLAHVCNGHDARRRWVRDVGSPFLAEATANGMRGEPAVALPFGATSLEVGVVLHVARYFKLSCLWRWHPQGGRNCYDCIGEDCASEKRRRHYSDGGNLALHDTGSGLTSGW